MSNIAKRHTMSIFGAGGLGCNIVQYFTNIPNDPDKPYFANTKLHIIDTSASNLSGINSSNITTSIINDASGAGKHRLKAFAGVSDQVNTLLNDHKPTDFNVIVTSLSGGSGSVICPLLAAEIIRRNRPVVIIATGSTTSAVETDNTIKTLQTLQGMASSGKTRGKAIPIVYLENSNNGNGISYMGTRVDNDNRIEEIIRQLAVLFAGNHRELDYTDLTNFLDYSKTSPDIRAQLVELMIFKGTEGLDAHRGVTITSASILASDEDEPPLLDQPYSAVGYYGQQVVDDTNIPNHHYILTPARIPQIFRGLEETAQQYRAAKETLMSADLSGMTSASDDDSGMVF